MEKKNDASLTLHLSKFVNVPYSILYASESMNGEQLTSIISKAKMTVSVRLHSLIFSACASVPMIGLVYDPKVSAFMHLAGIDDKYIINVIPDFETKLKIALDSLYHELESQKEQLQNRMILLRKSANNNADLTAKLIKEEVNK